MVETVGPSFPAGDFEAYFSPRVVVDDADAGWHVGEVLASTFDFGEVGEEVSRRREGQEELIGGVPDEEAQPDLGGALGSEWAVAAELVGVVEGSPAVEGSADGSAVLVAGASGSVLEDMHGEAGAWLGVGGDLDAVGAHAQVAGGGACEEVAVAHGYSSGEFPSIEDLFDEGSENGALGGCGTEHGSRCRPEESGQGASAVEEDAQGIVVESLGGGLSEVMFEKGREFVSGEGGDFFADGDASPEGRDVLEAFAQWRQSGEEEAQAAGAAEIGFGEGAGFAEGFGGQFVGFIEGEAEFDRFFAELRGESVHGFGMGAAGGDAQRACEDADEPGGPELAGVGEVERAQAMAIERGQEFGEEGGLAAAGVSGEEKVAVGALAERSLEGLSGADVVGEGEWLRIRFHGLPFGCAARMRRRR